MAGRLNKEDSGALTEKIIDAAFEAFCRSSFEDTTIKDIAAACSTTVRSVVRRFSTKDDLLIAVTRARGRVADAHLTPVDLDEAQGPIERLRSALAHFFAYQNHGLQNQFLRVCSGEAHRLPELAALLRSYEERWEMDLGAIIEQAQASGYFHRYDGETLAATLIAIFVSYPGILSLLAAAKLSRESELEKYFNDAWQLVLTMSEGSNAVS